MIAIIFLAVILYLLFKWGTSTFDYFEKRGIPYNKPYPFVGSRIGMLLRSSSAIDFIRDLYNEFKDEKISGMFEFRFPSYIIRDPQLIKRLCVKEFESFSEHREMIPTDTDPIMGKSLFFMKGNDWKDMRATMSPAFTGSKMRLMFTLMNDVTVRFCNTLTEKIKSSGNNRYEFKDLTRKLSVDVIATTAFGIEINSFLNPENEFYVQTSRATDFTSLKSSLVFAGFFFCKPLMKALKMTMFQQETVDFFESAVLGTMKERQEKGIVRHDFINLMMQVKKGTLTHEADEEGNAEGFATVKEHDIGLAKIKREWDDMYLVAQCFGFFFAGFETISTAMSFMAYELVRNPDIQKKLQEEVDEVNAELNGKAITYEVLQKMKYMDQVVSETFRLWPAAPIIDRTCSKDFNLEYDGKQLHFEKGRNFYLPIFGIHHDEKYFPNPEAFIPDRFSEENKDNINRDAYMPFGVGPRNCVGSRFALMEVKSIFYSLLLNFTLEATEETEIPIKIAKNQVMFALENGLHLALVPRN